MSLSALPIEAPSAAPKDLPAEVERPVQSVDVEWRASVVAILFLTILGLGLRLVFLNGPVGSDDVRYFNAAKTIVDGSHITSLDHAASRLVFLLVVGVPGVWLGSMFVSGIVNILISAATQLIATLFAYRRIGPHAGVIVAALLAFDGIAIAYSGILLPDNLLSLLFVGCAILVYQALVTDPRRAVTYMLGAGLAAGLAYSTKDTGILLLVPVIALVATSPSARPVGRQIRLGGVFVGAFVAVWVLEGLFYLIRAGDFLYKVHAIAAVHNAAIAPAANLLDFARHGYWNLASTLDSVWLTLVPLVVGLACWTILIVRRHDTAIFAAIGVFTSGFLFFGTSSLTHLVNLPYQERYFDPMLPFVAIAFAVVLGQAMAARPRRWRETVVAFIALATLVGGTFGAAARSGTLYFTEGLRNAAIAVAALPKDGLPVFAHEHARDGLAQYLPSSLASRVVQTGIGDGGDGVGYYLVILRDGVPLWPDSIFSARDQRSIRLTVSLSQRRVDAWNPVARRRARDSVIVYDLGRR